MLKVTHYQRKPRSAGNYSVEAIFQDVRTRLQSQLEIQSRVAPCLSNGLFRRLWIMLDAASCIGRVVHVTGDISFAAILVRKKRCILTILDCIDADGRKGLASWLYQTLWFRLPVARSRVVTTISDASKNDILRITGCAPEKVVVIGVAISPIFRRSDREFDTTRPRILQVGAAPNKNIERLAEALKPIPCHLTIVGKLNESQVAAIKHSGIECVCKAGLSEAELIDEYVNADIVAFASTFEGFGMPILEANAVGRPVVTGNCTSMPEVAGNAACIVDPFSVESIRAGFRRIIDNAEYRTTLVKNGFENVKRFDADHIAQQYLAVYQRVAGPAH